MRSERQLLIDCLDRLNRLKIPYMLVGSMASNYWGIPRTTHDLDFVIILDDADIPPFAAVFREGLIVQIESIRRAFSPPHRFNAIDEQSALRVDFWMLKDDPFERSAFDRRQNVTLFGTPASITTAEDVILHKFLWHSIWPSDRQLQDAAGVFAVQRDELDIEYLRRWAQSLGVQREVESLLTGELKPKST